MLKELKEIRNELNKNCQNQLKRDDEGRVVVDLTVRDDDGFLSPYSTDKYSAISADASEFIEHSLKQIPSGERIRFCIHSDTISEEEKAEYTDAIHSHYSASYKSIRNESKRLKKLALIMALVAVLALATMISLELNGFSAVFLTVIEIFAWVFMWEAVDIFFLQCTLLHIKEKRCLSLIDSKIEYLPIKNIY